MWFVVFVVLVFLFYFTGIRPLSYWKKRGVPSIQAWPYFGHIAPFTFRFRSIASVIDKSYYAFPEKRYIGFYNMSLPTLMIRDPELIKKLTVKEFDTFPEHRPVLPDDVDHLWSNGLFALKGGEKWQTIRTTINPAFTSSKMKLMFGQIKQCAEQFTNYFSKQGGTVTVEMKDAFTRLTNDVIATTAFGVTCNSLENKENEFYLMGKEISTFIGIRNFILMLHKISPVITKLLNIPLFDKSVTSFFTRLVKETVKVREENKSFRPDMIQLLMEIRKSAKTKTSHNSDKKVKSVLTDDEIAAQVLVFLFAGFDNVSTMLSYAAYELAVNPDIQERLHKEVDLLYEKTGGIINYETVMEMKYLDMILSETLRKWPPFPLNDRQSVKPYTIEPESPGEKPVRLDKGSVIAIPVYSIHRDPKYFPNPEKFDPERFSEENKNNIKPFTFLTFGSGPRNCIGARFALLEGKVIISEIVRKFEIVVVERTQIPLEMTKDDDIILPTDGFWLGLKPRK